MFSIHILKKGLMKYFKKIKNKKNFFAGWYFKHTGNYNFALIPSISINNGIKKAYIQIITSQFSHTFSYPYSLFKSYKDKIIIGDNTFTIKGIEINLKDQDYHISGKTSYDKIKTIKQDIMGPFRFFPFLECKHDIISMGHQVKGNFIVNGKELLLSKEKGYIESDYGTSFPSKYIWIQCNDFKYHISLSFACATIPIFNKTINGFLCSLIIGDKEYRFATYNKAKLLEFDDNHFVIQKGKLYLGIYFKNNNPTKLIAPQKGEMNRIVYETIDGEVNLNIIFNNQKILSVLGKHAGIEISQ